MTNQYIRPSALVLTTTPPIPREYGNRNRVFQTIQFLRKLGYSISLLLYPFDEDWVSGIPAYYPELNSTFEYFAVIPNTRPLHMVASGFHHTVDEWWDDSIGNHLSWLFKRRNYDVFFVNYTFMSKAFEFAPQHTIRILDTHDLFTNRRESFEKHGVAPEFFYTNAQEEKVAFDRSDAILGIKNSESLFIRELTKKYVVTIPYWSDGSKKTKPRNVIHQTFSHDRPFRVGFIGAQNSVNVVNLRRFLHVFDRYVKLYNLPIEVVVAGNVCRQLHTNYNFLRKLGRIAELASFYDSIDAVVAPLEFSTGIKIKVGEALAWDVPVIATANAFDGFRSFSSTQIEPSVASLCSTLASIATNEISYSSLVEAGRRAARSAARNQEKGFSELRSWMKSRMRRLILVTNRPFWYRGTLLDELISQTIEFISEIAPTLVVAINDEEVISGNVYAQVQYVRLGNFQEIAGLLSELSDHCKVGSGILFLDSVLHAQVSSELQFRGVEVWIGDLSEAVGSDAVTFKNISSDDRSLAVSPLRYPPLQSVPKREGSKVTVFRNSIISERDKLILSFIVETASLNGIEISQIFVPEYSQYDANFLREVINDPSPRIILLGTDPLPSSFLCQLASYRDIKCQVITRELTCPQVAASVHSLPSLTRSIEAFLLGDLSMTGPSGPNTGWSSLWASLT